MLQHLHHLAIAASLLMPPMAFGITALAPSDALANTTTVSISAPMDGASIIDTHAIVSGLASAIGDGKGIDLMLVLDNSGSLSTTDPTKERFSAVRQLFSTLDANANVSIGLVRFEADAALQVALQSASGSRSAIEQWMQTANPGGGTSISSGIRKATEEFVAKGRSGSSKIILVFTDGQDTSSDAETAAQAAVSQGAVVHIVGLFSNDPGGEAKAKSIVQHGQGQLFLASNPAQLSSLFSSSQLVGIDRVTVTNKTTGVAALTVNFAAGSYSAPLNLVEGANVLEAVAYSTDGNTATASVTVNVPPKPCPDRNRPDEADYRADCSIVPPLYQVKLRPQVLMAGFDPILLDIGDDEFKVMAVVREGATPIRHVKLSENTGSLAMSMNLEGQLPNGDKVYSLTFVGARFLPSMNDMLSNLFGSKAGEFNIMVVDQASMTHSFPHLEFGNNQDVARDTALTTAQTYQTKGIQRGRPQTLMVGFDPVMIDLRDSSFKVKALVRRGSVAIRSVTLKTNNNFFAVKMNKEASLPNGDEMYSTEMTFPRGAFPAGAFKDLFGTAAQEEFVVETKDEASQSHQFPALNVCDCPTLN